MSVMIGNARISERGTVNGAKGDQTGKEVMIQTWASGGRWSYVIRPKSATVAKKLADAMIAACKNNNIGYSQADRLSLYKLASKNGWNLAKVGKCNCDCSSLVAVCCNAAGVKIPSTIYTGNELNFLKSTGKFDIFTGVSYTQSSAHLKAGDILLRSGHTAIVTEGAKPAAKPAAKKPAAKKPAAKKPAAKKPAKKSIKQIAKEVIAGKWGNGDARKKKLKAAGYDYKAVQKEVNKLL